MKFYSEENRTIAKTPKKVLTLGIFAIVFLLFFSFFVDNSWAATAKSTKVVIKTPVKTVTKPVVPSVALQAVPSKDTEFLTMAGGAVINHTVTIKNTGSKTWAKGAVTFETGPFLKSFSLVKSASWISNFCPATLTKDVKTGETATIKFAITAPRGLQGTIQENFQLVINNKPIAGSMVRFFIDLAKEQVVDNNSNTQTPQSSTVTSPIINLPAVNTNPISSTIATATKKTADFCIALSPENKSEYSECNTPSEKNTTSGIATYAKVFTTEPLIRTGIFNTKAAQRITSNTYYDVYASSTLLLSSIEPNYQLTVSFDFVTKIYSVSSPSITKSTTTYLRFVPRDKNNGIMTMLDWNKSSGNNQFRNIIEFRYSPKTGNFWVINELPINYYLRGLAETSNLSSLEFQKVLITAARTYVMYHYLRGLEYGMTYASTKHATEFFHVDSVYDQVYKGYGSESRMPKLTQAIAETNGAIVTYNNDLAITPFFSNSDGRTRDWTEVWGGKGYPWLKSVVVPEDNGQKLWGHGVGMSARGALLMAANGKKWQDILKYFYTGTELQKIY